MANMSPMNKLRNWTIKDAQFAGQIVAVTCNKCGVTHRYLPEDLLKLRGDMNFARLLHKFKCEKHGDDAMWLNVEDPHAARRQALYIRRLVDIRVRHIPVWEDVPL